MRRLSPRAARSFYNVADAVVPPRGDEPGAGDVDLVPALEAQLAREPALRRLGLRLMLEAVELHSYLGLRPRRFSKLPREERAARLEAWARSGLAPRRAVARALRERVESLWRAHRGQGGTYSLGEA